MLLAAAAAMRAALLAYGAHHDDTRELPYTDADYGVYSDAAALLHEGASPYARPTFRYTPLLALTMLPNATLHPMCGKLCFVVADLAVGAALRALLARQRVPGREARLRAAVWLLNPIVANVSTRGNADSLVALLVLAALLALARDETGRAGALVAAAAHLKPYAIVYIASLLCSLDGRGSGVLAPPASGPALDDASIYAPPRLESSGVAGWPRPADSRREKGCGPWRARSQLLLGFAGTYGVLSLACITWCGGAFVREALMYHVLRADTRHNFSPFFYAFYTTSPAAGGARDALALVGFLPQLVLQLLVALRCARDLPFCVLLQTALLVAFNKVCTAQYFVWPLALLPLSLPGSTAHLGPRIIASAGMCGLGWLIAVAHWLDSAYRLEFAGVGTYRCVWRASVLFFIANVAAAVCSIVHYQGRACVHERGAGYRS